jgi:nascent polypeptide-associated complex subunit alpha
MDCLSSVPQVLGNDADLVSKVKQSRGEKKARKIMSKLGLKQVSEYSDLHSNSN